MEAVWEFDAASQGWRLWSPALPQTLQALQALEPGGIYFLLASRATFWVAPRTPPPAAPAAAAGEQAQSWQLTFTRTTPLFDLDDRLIIDASGGGIVQSLNAGTRAVTVDAPRLALIASLLSANDYFRGYPSDSRSGCVSCFHYRLTVRAPSGGSNTLQTDGLGLSGALMQTVDQLVAALIAGLS